MFVRWRARNLLPPIKGNTANTPRTICNINQNGASNTRSILFLNAFLFLTQSHSGNVSVQ